MFHPAGGVAERQISWESPLTFLFLLPNHKQLEQRVTSDLFKEPCWQQAPEGQSHPAAADDRSVFTLFKDETGTGGTWASGVFREGQEAN